MLLLFRRSIINNLIIFLLAYSVVQEINLICSIIPLTLECLKITFLREKNVQPVWCSRIERNKAIIGARDLKFKKKKIYLYILAPRTDCRRTCFNLL